MKRALYVIAGIIVVGGLLVASAAVHKEHTQKAATLAQNAQTRLQIVEGVDAKNLQMLQTKLDASTVQSKTDQSALCGFIRQYTPKTVTIPAQCSQS